VSGLEIRLSQLRETIDRARDDLVALTQSLIQLPTVNPPGDGYLAICELLDARLSLRGFKTERVRAKGALGDSDQYPRWNIIARHDGQYGACDMKGGLAASIIAAEAFIDTFPEYAGAIEISGTCDEESGGFGGVAYLAEHGWFSPERIQHVIIPEPLNKDRICLGHRGVLWTEVNTFGHIAHGSMPFLGDCAVRHMGAVVSKFEENLFPALAKRRTDMPVVPDGARQSTLNINSIHGGKH